MNIVRGVSNRLTVSVIWRDSSLEGAHRCSPVRMFQIVASSVVSSVPEGGECSFLSLVPPWRILNDSLGRFALDNFDEIEANGSNDRLQ